FGEEALHSCEVMLHDMDMSKRLNTTMKSKAGDVADCVIISDSYWPSLQVDGVRHHSKISSLLESYAAEFALAKKPMKLDIVPQLGQVVLALEFDDGSNGEFTVLPLQ
ncbi:APC2, partial [Symbiodinium microadriaticum]